MNIYDLPHSFSMHISEMKKMIDDAQAKDFDNYAYCNVIIKATDTAGEFTFDNLALTKANIEEIIAYIDKTINKEIEHNHQIRFVEKHIPEIYGRSLISFHIYASEEHSNDYWEFRYDAINGAPGSGDMHYSIGLSLENLIELKDSLIAQMEKIDWKSHGKIFFFDMTEQLNGAEYRYWYSAEEMQKEFDGICKGHKLLKMFVSLDGYYYAKITENGLDFYNMGGEIILVFDEFAIGLIIHGEGMFTGTILKDFNFDKCHRIFDYPRSNCRWEDDRELMVDMCKSIDIDYEQQKVTKCEVEPTDMYAFKLSDFEDEKADKAADNNDLPEKLAIHLENGRTLYFYGDSLEYFGMYYE